MSFTTDDLKTILDGGTIDLLPFLIENHGKITRITYDGREYNDHQAACLVFSFLAKTDEAIRNYIDSLSPLSEATYREKLFGLLTGEGRICPRSNKPKTFKDKTLSYNFCDKQGRCVCQSESFAAKTRGKSGAEKDLIERRKRATMLERFGVEHPSESTELRAKGTETSLKRYGVASPLANSSVREKIKKTNLERYGADHVLSSPEVREKITETMKGRYGAENPMLVDEIKGRVQSTNLERYGSISPMGDEGIRDKAKQTTRERFGVDNALERDAAPRVVMENTNLERYGARNVTDSKEIQEKIRQTHVDRYGVELWNNPDFRNRSELAALSEKAKNVLHSKETLIAELNTKSLNFLAQHLEVNPKTIARYAGIHGINLRRKGSSYERELAAFLAEHNVVFEANTRSIIPPQEIDLYVPDKKLGIEFNGVYWHSDKIVENDYHVKKFRRATDAGVRLIMIREDEFRANPEAIKLKLLHVLGLGGRGAGARKHNIRRISNKDGLAFAQKHHIQGSPGTCQIAYGSFLNDELVSVVLFSKQRNTGALELIRFCTNGPAYPGLFSRIFKRFVEENPEIETVLSFADLRYSSGNVYEKCGFHLDGIIPHDYSYVAPNGEVFHKSSFTKAKIAKKFGLDVSNRTERELMDELGFSRIYDCGKLRYIWYRQLR